MKRGRSLVSIYRRENEKLLSAGPLVHRVTWCCSRPSCFAFFWIQTLLVKFVSRAHPRNYRGQRGNKEESQRPDYPTAPPAGVALCVCLPPGGRRYSLQLSEASVCARLLGMLQWRLSQSSTLPTASQLNASSCAAVMAESHSRRL